MFTYWCRIIEKKVKRGNNVNDWIEYKKKKAPINKKVEAIDQQNGDIYEGEYGGHGSFRGKHTTLKTWCLLPNQRMYKWRKKEENNVHLY